MTDHAMLGGFRLRVILRAQELGNVSRACQEFGVSRTTYYKWFARWLQFGPGGLEPHAKRQPQMPNQVSAVVEQAILDYISVWPTHGPRRIANQLGQPEWGGHLISHWGVYKVLRRRCLHQRPRRLRRFELLQARATGILTEYTRELVAARPARAELEAKSPGQLVGLDTFYVGRLKGVGKVWQYTATDVASSYTFCWLTDGNDAERAAHFLELLFSHYRDLGIWLRRVLTDNGPEYVGRAFRDRLASLGVEQTRIKPGRPATNGHVERFHGTVLHEFYRLAFRRRYYRSVAELQGDLAGFVGWYNHRRTHSGQRLRGRTPAAVFTHPANGGRAAA
ncbi:MAG: IS481 family transposase [bacterium]|nr:IS481 family transposase [bacterium]